MLDFEVLKGNVEKRVPVYKGINGGNASKRRMSIEQNLIVEEDLFLDVQQLDKRIEREPSVNKVFIEVPNRNSYPDIFYVKHPRKIKNILNHKLGNLDQIFRLNAVGLAV